MRVGVVMASWAKSSSSEDSEDEAGETAEECHSHADTDESRQITVEQLCF